MSYVYENIKPLLFTEDGQIMFLKIRDNTQRLLKEAGAARMDKMWKDVGGDTWSMMACADRLMELGELIEITPPGSWGQHRIFTDTRGVGR